MMRRCLDVQIQLALIGCAPCADASGGAAGAGAPSLEEVADALVALESSNFSRSFVTGRAYLDSSSSEDDDQPGTSAGAPAAFTLGYLVLWTARHQFGHTAVSIQTAGEEVCSACKSTPTFGKCTWTGCVHTLVHSLGLTPLFSLF